MILLFSPIFIPTFIIIYVRLIVTDQLYLNKKELARVEKNLISTNFRTMYQGSELELSNIYPPNESKDEFIFKLKKDPRVTRIGRWLRKTSMDELPQVFNVLKENVDLVGLEPPIRDEVAKYSLDERKRLLIQPGITCLWQISGQ